MKKFAGWLMFKFPSISGENDKGQLSLGGVAFLGMILNQVSGSLTCLKKITIHRVFDGLAVECSRQAMPGSIHGYTQNPPGKSWLLHG